MSKSLSMQMAFLFFCLSHFPPLISQPSLDSLKQIVQTAPLDTGTITALRLICDRYHQDDLYDSLEAYTSLLISMSYTLEDEATLGKGYEMLCSSHWHLGKLTSAVAACDSALKYYGRVENIRRQMTSKHLKGMIHMQAGQFDQSAKMYYEAIELAKVQDDSMVIGVVLNGVASVHLDMGQYELAEQAFLESIVYLENEQYAYRRGMSMVNLGILYHTLRNHNAALFQFDSAIVIFQRLGAERWEISAKGSKGGTLVNIGRAAEAIPLLEENLTYFQGKDPIYESEALGMLARAYSKVGNWTKAKELYERGLILTQASGMLENQRRHLENLSEIAEQNKDFQTAFDHLKAAKILADSLYNIASATTVTELTQKYEAEKKEAEILQLQTENQLKTAMIRSERNARWSLIGGIFFLLLLGALAWNSQRRKWKHQQLLTVKNEEIRESVFKQQLTELELKALRSQMNPHFIFNCMNSINRMILEDNNELASRTLGKFAKLIRLILEHSERQHITLKEELTLLETYLSLEAQRFKGQINYEIKVDTDLNAEEIEVPSMVLQPFIENAIWHGLMHKEGEDGWIWISIQEQEETLICSIEDNGIGREKALELKKKSAGSHTSMGMQVTEDRLKLLDTQKRGKHIRIIDLKDAANRALGTRVELSIPL